MQGQGGSQCEGVQSTGGRVQSTERRRSEHRREAVRVGNSEHREEGVRVGGLGVQGGGDQSGEPNSGKGS